MWVQGITYWTVQIPHKNFHFRGETTAARGGKAMMRPFAKLLCTLVLVTALVTAHCVKSS